MKSLTAAVLITACWLTVSAARFDETFDADACRVASTFKLPSAASIDDYDKFCSCHAQTVEQNKLLDRHGTSTDVDVPKCNADGTCFCVHRHFHTPPPGVECLTQRGKRNIGILPRINTETEECKKGGYCQPACMRYSITGDGKWKNVGNCPCSVAANQELNPDISVDQKYVPQCNPDKSWKKEQTGYGGRWCVDDQRNQVGSATYAALGQQAASCS